MSNPAEFEARLSAVETRMEQITADAAVLTANLREDDRVKVG